ncbi:MAG: radical SAM protein [Candidatus Omnitrophota bacterium]|jgi:radical SAM superfamily enzyme YgiQ (UPF0313 family)
MRILLIQPSEFKSTVISRAYSDHGALKIIKGGSIRRVMALPPLGLMYLATPLLGAGHQVIILDAHTLQLSNGEIAREAARINPDLIGITVYSTYLTVVHYLTEILKKTVNVPILLGGPHITAAPQESLSLFTHADYFLSGWAEISIIDFIDFMNGNRTIKDIPGLCYIDNGMFNKNQDPVLPETAEGLIAPSREPLKDMYTNHLYFNIMSSRKNMDALLTSRICPFSCKFCFSPGRSRLLAHTPGKVMQDISEMVNRGINAIEIMDDTFTVNRDRAEEIADRVIESKFELEFRLRSRVDQISPELLKKFKRMGVRSISYGMESGSQVMLDYMNKKTTIEQNESACFHTKKSGILCQTSWVFGYPGETKKTRNETLRFIEKISPDTFTFYPLLPLPGTQVYEEAKKNNTLIGAWDIDKKTPYIRTDEVTDLEQFELFISKEHHRLLMRPRYLFQVFFYLVKHPNLRLISLGLLFLFNKITDIEALIKPKN